jgi:flagellar motor protein MotB
MRTILITFAVLGLLTAQASGQTARIRQRASALANPTNNVQQATNTPPSPPSTSATASRPATPAAPAVPLTPTTQQKSAAKLKADLAAVRAKGEATPALKQQFAKDLLAAARGTAKPSAYSTDRFSDVLLTRIADKSVSAGGDAKLIQSMVLAVNSFGLSSTRTQEIVNDLQSALKTAGMADDNVTAVGNEFKTLALEVQTFDVK